VGGGVGFGVLSTVIIWSFRKREGTEGNFSKGLSSWIAKHSDYARAEASYVFAQRPTDLRSCRVQDLFDTGLRRRLLKSFSMFLPGKPIAAFVYVFIIQKGFLDGRNGFRYAMLFAFYQWMIDLNLYELYSSSGKGISISSRN
jgi:hypothetical protein